VSLALINFPTSPQALVLLTITEGATKNLIALQFDDAWSSFMVQASYLRPVITTYRKVYLLHATHDLL
jgi:hypothetical protein